VSPVLPGPGISAVEPSEVEVPAQAGALVVSLFPGSHQCVYGLDAAVTGRIDSPSPLALAGPTKTPSFKKVPCGAGGAAAPRWHRFFFQSKAPVQTDVSAT